MAGAVDGSLAAVVLAGGPGKRVVRSYRDSERAYTTSRNTPC